MAERVRLIPIIKADSFMKAYRTSFGGTGDVRHDRGSLPFDTVVTLDFSPELKREVEEARIEREKLKRRNNGT